jgi:hypothetical protein
LVTLKELIIEGWVQQGKSFGLNYQFCVLVKDTKVAVFNTQFETFVISEFEVPLKKKEKASTHSINLSKQDYYNDNPVSDCITQHDINAAIHL